MPRRLLKAFVVEDDPTLCQALTGALEADDRITAVGAHSLADAVEMCHREAQVVLLVDLGLPDAGGVDAVRRLRHELPTATLVVVTGADALRKPALAAGAHAVILKTSPQSHGQGLVDEVRRAVIAHDVELLFRPGQENFDRTERTLDRAAKIVAPSLLAVALLAGALSRASAAEAEELRRTNALMALRDAAADPGPGPAPAGSWSTEL